MMSVGIGRGEWFGCRSYFDNVGYRRLIPRMPRSTRNAGLG
jgi:hypothetical protein